MAKRTGKEKPDTKTLMRMDQDGRTAFGRPRPLVEPPPFPKDEEGRTLAMAADTASSQVALRQPFLLEEPKPK